MTPTTPRFPLPSRWREVACLAAAGLTTGLLVRQLLVGRDPWWLDVPLGAGGHAILAVGWLTCRPTSPVRLDRARILAGLAAAVAVAVALGQAVARWELEAPLAPGAGTVNLLLDPLAGLLALLAPAVLAWPRPSWPGRRPWWRWLVVGTPMVGPAPRWRSVRQSGPRP